MSREQFYKDLPAYSSHPTTATPGIGSFNQAYQRAFDEGAEAVLSIHISEALSATVNVARTAAAEFEGQNIQVIDSGQLSMGTGFQVELAGRLAKQGADVEQIQNELADLGKRTFVAAKLASLEYLKRSGRMNPFMTGLASMLSIVPILTMQSGNPGSERVRTTSKANARLLEMVEQCRPLERIVLLHSNSGGALSEFAELIPELVAEEKIVMANITPVIGVHVGPDAVGFAAVTKK